MTVGTGVVSGASVAHERASIDELERAAAESEAAAVRRLLSVPDVEEAFALQTCNRTEAYVVTADATDGRASLAALYEGVSDDAVVELGHEESLRHLMRVAAGLESLVTGEDQILGQVKRAFERAREAGAIGPTLEEGIGKAVSVGERARTETAINEGTVSVASAAVRMAASDAPVDGATGLVVGAGDMGRLAARNLAERVGHLYVANRSPDRAASVAEAVDVSAEAVALDALPSAVEESRVVLTATDSDDYLFDPDLFRGAGETYVVDIAQPRDVPPAVRKFDDVTLRDIDALETVTDEHQSQRETAAEAVEEMIDVEFEHLQSRYKRKRADQVISAMYESAERVKARELETAFEKLDGFDGGQREVVEAMADALVNQLLAAPTKSLRDAAEQDDWSTINAALQLFDPEFGPENVTPPGVDSPDTPGAGDEIPEAVRERMPAAILDNLTDD